MHKKAERGRMRHVSAAELLEGIRVYALQEYGPMALTVLRQWGLNSTEDVGEVVFNLVESGKLGKTEVDRRLYFANGYDFAEAFAAPFQPRGDRSAGRSGKDRPVRAANDTNDNTHSTPTPAGGDDQ
jgi:uncharacterized repeat protein (TIGR04138 family)